MKKFTIVNYHLPNIFEVIGYRDREEVEGDIFKIAEEIFNKGVNVMICHSGEELILFVDKYNFKQR